MPALVDGGLVIADSEAIAEYLNETIAEPAMQQWQANWTLTPRHATLAGSKTP